MLLSVFTQRVARSFFKKNFTSWTLIRSIVGLKRLVDQKKRARDFTDREQANNRKKRYGLSLSPRERERKTIVDNKYKRHQQHTHNLCTPSRTDTLLSLPSGFFVAKKSSKTRRCRSSRSVSSAFGWLGRPLWTIFSPYCGGSFSRDSISFLRRSRLPRSRRTASR